MQPSNTSSRAGRGLQALLLLMATGGDVLASDKPIPAPTRAPAIDTDAVRLQAELKAMRQQLQKVRQTLAGLRAELATARQELVGFIRARDAARKAGEEPGSCVKATASGPRPPDPVSGRGPDSRRPMVYRWQADGSEQAGNLLPES